MLLGCEPATVARASVILMVLGFGCMLLCCMLRAFMLHAVLLQVEKECERLKVNLEQEKSARYSIPYCCTTRVLHTVLPECAALHSTQHGTTTARVGYSTGCTHCTFPRSLTAYQCSAVRCCPRLSGRG
jgi:hypothetical protein